MFNTLIFSAITLLISGGLLLTVDTKIYAVGHMNKEKKYARLFGWTHLGLFILSIVAILFYI
ncbi:CLC_0170 family protein [Paenibacillus sp. NPDC058177]|uniref:CLC_0170 family protein n=1 Tax=Paenibacillus sp. NPDC058177 TaxID=3346369 RepID=UPI0036DF20C9